MKYVDEFRDAEDAQKLFAAIRRITTREHTLMEVCGGQTHTLIRTGIDRMLPPEITLIHGPGCPVCVTSVELIDAAIELAQRPGMIMTSFGDMLRVPGTATDLLHAKAEGADVRIVYSPLDAVAIARNHPDNEVVFFGVGFETTAPANAMAVARARQEGIRNFSLLASHVLVPPAIEAIMAAPDNRVEGFLAAGHVCSVMGFWEYEPLAQRHQVPIVVTGFEPVDLLQGIHMAVQALEEGKTGVQNQYRRSVSRQGNLPAQKLLGEIFEVCDRDWRGLGTLPKSGLRLRAELAELDAEQKFGIGRARPHEAREKSECIAGEILRGLKRPHECAAFGGRCQPDHPLGAPMVSAEGACAAYYRYGRSAAGLAGGKA